jgi:hypothetical protein
MMNILPRNPADREEKSPCDKNIRYPVYVPGHDWQNGTTFLTIVVYDKQKTAHLDHPLGRFSYYGGLGVQCAIYRATGVRRLKE